MSGTLRAKGRHARPAAAEAARRLVRRRQAVLAGALWPSSRRARLVLAGACGLSGAVAAGLVAIVVSASAGSGAGPKAVAVNAVARRPAPAPFAQQPLRLARSARSAQRGDEAALAFVERRDPLRAGHVIQIVWTGPMLRVYTDLPASEADSRTAIALCEAAATYAETQNRIPAVFVHANRTAGYPVLANKLNSRDDCRLGRVP